VQTTEEKFRQILDELHSLANPDAIAGMERFGITPGQTFGIKIPELRRIARAHRKNHALALRLWAYDSRETRILAGMIDDPTQLTEDQMETWTASFDYWEICDQCCMNLFEKALFAYRKAVEYSRRSEEFFRRTGFVLMARLAVSDKKAADEAFEPFLPLIKAGASDERNLVKKAVNWALRQIGKRNRTLYTKCIDLAEEIALMESKSARWIAADALRELKSRPIRDRLGIRED